MTSLRARTLYTWPKDLAEDDVYDLAPLARLEGLTITLGTDTPVLGEEHFPPERVRRVSTP
ncbi:hypothetical protein [Streptomyces sp. NPDC001665]